MKIAKVTYKEGDHGWFASIDGERFWCCEFWGEVSNEDIESYLKKSCENKLSVSRRLLERHYSVKYFDTLPPEAVAPRA